VAHANLDPDDDYVLKPPEHVEGCEAELAQAGVKFRTASIHVHNAPKAKFTCGAPQVVTYLFRELPVQVAHGSHPLLVVRGDDREVSAFLNVCRHRGTRVEDVPCGHEKKAFVRPYHAWSYARDGHLLGIPHDEGFAGIDRSGRGLGRVPAGEAGGLVWARPSRAASEAEARAAGRTRLARSARGQSRELRPRLLARLRAAHVHARARLEASDRRLPRGVPPADGARGDDLPHLLRQSRPGRSGRPAPAERLPEAHHRDARLASGTNEAEVVFGAFEHSNAHFHAEIGRRIG